MALPPVVPLQTPTGKYLTFASGDLINFTLAKTGSWEPWTVDLAHALVTQLDPRPGTIIDAGANLGAITVALAHRLSPEYTFHCFEMQRIVYYQLCGNIVMNGFENIHAHNLGLGAADGAVMIPRPNYASDQNIGAVSADKNVRDLRNGPDTDHAGAATDSASFRRLDTFELRDVRLIKADVEGMELKVLEGGAETLALSGYPPLILEVWKTGTVDGFAGETRALLKHLGRLGYGCQVIGSICIAQHSSRPWLKAAWDRTANTFVTTLQQP